MSKTKINEYLRRLNVRKASKIIATEIIDTIEICPGYQPQICKQLHVSGHLHTYHAIAYFVDNCISNIYGYKAVDSEAIQELYSRIVSEVRRILGIDSWI